MRKLLLAATMLVGALDGAFAQMEQVVAEAFCSRNPMSTMGNVDALLKQGLVTEEAAGDAAYNAFLRCVPWAYANDMRVARIFEWNKKDIQLPIGDVYRVRYPNNNVRQYVFVHPVKKFEYMLENLKYGSLDQSSSRQLEKLISNKNELNKTFCLKDNVVSYLMNASTQAMHFAVEHGADIDEPFLDKSEDIPSSVIDDLKVRRGVLNSNFLLIDGIFFGDGANDNRCEQFAPPTSEVPYRTVLDHFMSGQVSLNRNAIMGVLKDGAIARPDQLHSFFGPWGWTVHFSSYYPDNKVMFEALLKAGANINGRNESGQTILGRLLKQPMSPDDLKYLTSKGAKL